MSDSKKKIGLILPAQNTVTRSDLEKIAPLEAEVYETRILFGRVTPKELKKMEEGAARASKELAAIPCDAIVFACTAASFIGGPKVEQDILDTIRTQGQCAGVTTSGSVLKAIEGYGVKEITICTPYTDIVNEKERNFFESQGIQVTKITGMGLLEPRDIIALSHEEIIRAAREAVTERTKLLFLSCTGLHSTDVIQALEEELHIPVLGSNQVSAWAGLRAAGILTQPEGFGSLLKQF